MVSLTFNKERSFLMSSNVPFPTNPDKVVLAGDWHGNTPRGIEVIRIAHELGAPVVLHLGDFGFWTPGPSTSRYLTRLNRECVELGITLLWVDGNHECFTDLYLYPTNDEGVRPILSNIIHLPRGFRWKWHTDTWMSLGGAHSVDTFTRKEGVSVWKEEHLSARDVRHAIEGGHVDVMVTHDCPSGVDIPGLTNQFPDHELRKAAEHRETLSKVVDSVQPLMLFHGHYHVFYRARRPRPSGGDTIVIGLADDMSPLRDNYMVLNLSQSGR